MTVAEQYHFITQVDPTEISGRETNRILRQIVTSIMVSLPEHGPGLLERGAFINNLNKKVVI